MRLECLIKQEELEIWRVVKSVMIRDNLGETGKSRPMGR